MRYGLILSRIMMATGQEQEIQDQLRLQAAAQGADDEQAAGPKPVVLFYNLPRPTLDGHDRPRLRSRFVFTLRAAPG